MLKVIGSEAVGSPGDRGRSAKLSGNDPRDTRPSSLHREPERLELAGATFSILRQKVLVELGRGDART